MKNYFIIIIGCLTLLGCNPMNTRQGAVRDFMETAEAKASTINKKYKAKIRQIKPYQVYRYQTELLDPFRAREFVQEKSNEQDNNPIVVDNRCEPPQCIPPTPHAKSLLENYSLNSLGFVGTLNNKGNVALIQTPDYGVMQVKVGDYMGKNNGKVLAIKETAIVLQEKIRKGGAWENKKTVLVIKR